MSAKIDSILRQVIRLTPDERAELIKSIETSVSGEPDKNLPDTNGKPDYLAMFGSGRGAFESASEADEFIRQERNAWEK